MGWFRASSSYGVNLDQILEQRERLMVAKEAGWDAFRDAWIDVMQKPITTRDTSRSRPKTKAEATAIADRACERARELGARGAERMARIAERRADRRAERRAEQEKRRIERRERLQRSEAARQEHRLRQVDKAVARFTKVVEEERRRKLAQTRERSAGERARRARRWQWARDPQRTLEELMRGPPE